MKLIMENWRKYVNEVISNDTLKSFQDMSNNFEQFAGSLGVITTNLKKDSEEGKRIQDLLKKYQDAGMDEFLEKIPDIKEFAEKLENPEQTAEFLNNLQGIGMKPEEIKQKFEEFAELRTEFDEFKKEQDKRQEESEKQRKLNSLDNAAAEMQ